MGRQTEKASLTGPATGAEAAGGTTKVDTYAGEVEVIINGLLIECVKCHYKEGFPLGVTPWNAWPKGCPECKSSKVDVTLAVKRP